MASRVFKRLSTVGSRRKLGGSTEVEPAEKAGLQGSPGKLIDDWIRLYRG